MFHPNRSNPLLATRMREGADQVTGCLLFSTEPDAEALVVGLVEMGADTGVFAPVLPLGRAQAEALAEASIAIDELMDDAISLIGIAADRLQTFLEATADDDPYQVWVVLATTGRHVLPDIALHGPRRTWATVALENGVHPRVVQERLGHSNIATAFQI
jgi:site-specific recombinase XerC